MADGRADRGSPPHNAVVVNAKSAGAEKVIKITLYLGWSWVEWFWRGYILGYKTPILAFSGKTGFS